MVYMPIYSCVIVIDGMVFFQAGIVFFQVVQTLAEDVEIGVQWREETILDGTWQEIWMAERRVEEFWRSWSSVEGGNNFGRNVAGDLDGGEEGRGILEELEFSGGRKQFWTERGRRFGWRRGG